MDADELVARVTARQSARPVRGVDLLGDLLQPGDAGADFATSDNYYSWYYHVAAELRPRRLVEFGVRYGYSLKVVLDGSGQSPVEVWGFDDERDGAKTLHVFRAYFAARHVGAFVTDGRDTQTLTTDDVPRDTDLAHVDAWHTEPGCFHECALAFAAVRSGGFVLVDDTNPGPVRDGAERFCRERSLTGRFLPTLRGLFVFQKE